MINLPSHKEKGPAPKPEPKPEKPRKPIPRVSKKQRGVIRENNAFYEDFVRTHPTGKCYECDMIIYMPGWSYKNKGMNVCHLWSAKVCPREAYLDKDNAELTCVTHHRLFETSKNKPRDVPKLYALAQQRIPELKLKYKPYGTI